MFDIITPSTALTAGILVVGIIFLVFVNNLLQGWAKTENAVNKPMSITHYTQKTPAELMLDARGAARRRRIFWISLLITVWIGVRIANPDLASEVEAAVLDVLVVALQGLGNVIDFLLQFAEGSA